MSILIVGSVALDTVETPTGRAEEVLGGAATYASVAASFFHRVNMVAAVGEDFDQGHVEYLQGLGIDTTGLVTYPGKTFRWHGKYLPNMQDRETLDTQLNVFEKFDPVLPQHYRQSELVFLANIHPALQIQVAEQVESTKFIACDTMNLWIDTARDELVSLLPRLDMLLLNDEEARMLSGHFNLLRAARAILQMGVKQVIIKRGEHGATLVTEDSVFISPAFPLDEVVDPTGAGDCFAGGFMGELARSEYIDALSIRKAMVYGSVMASYNVESFSLARLKEINMDQIEARYELFKNLTSFY